MGGRREAVRAAQVLLGVTADGQWGPETDAAFRKVDVKVQNFVNAALAKADLSVSSIHEYQAAKGDEIKAVYKTRVVPLILSLASERGMNGRVMVGQLNLESGNGAHIPPNSNNWGGIKARPGEPSVVASTKEGVNGSLVTVNQAFRKYDTPEDFARDYVTRLASSRRYSNAYRLADNRMAAEAIKAAGYATDPNYVLKLERAANAVSVT